MLILVSESGFYAPGRTLALSSGAIPLAPEDIDPTDPVGAVVGKLKSLWPKTIGLIPQSAEALVLRPDGTPVRATSVAPDWGVYFEDGTEATAIGALFHRMFAGKKRMIDQIGLVGIAENRDEFFKSGALGRELWWERDGELCPTYLRYDEVDPPELHQLMGLEVTGRAIIKVSEVPLAHKRLGEIAYSFGEGKVGDQDALIVVTEHGDQQTAVVRFKDAPGLKGE
jgi:hypothetical protein